VKDDCWRTVWIEILKANGSHLDLCSMQLDGSQRPCKKQGEPIGYQGRKAAKITNALFLSDKEGQPLTRATPQATIMISLKSRSYLNKCVHCSEKPVLI
jgi:hypothetical protein